jgi:hypothetical protein
LRWKIPLINLLENNDVSYYWWNYQYNIFLIILYIVSVIPSLITDELFSISNYVRNHWHKCFVAIIIKHYWWKIFCRCYFLIV